MADDRERQPLADGNTAAVRSDDVIVSMPSRCAASLFPPIRRAGMPIAGIPWCQRVRQSARPRPAPLPASRLLSRQTVELGLAAALQRKRRPPLQCERNAATVPSTPR